MYLTKLEIFGFKSFAQKAAFTFDEGLTGIIGPNGCGKSNIVDAIRWVLGEQRPRILRCDKMENLLFNGTATRKPLSMAEITMHIENNRDILPSEYTEVKITRRLYRSGESEYLINNQQVRLMDILNLFADTGMGADAYSVIELKMVEQILSDNALERRRLFEEAAGIKKYKARRKSALAKLETTEGELVRLDDILSEVQKNVNSLSRQVGKARRYHEFKQRLSELDLHLAFLKIRTYEHDLSPLATEMEQVTNSRDLFNSQVHQEEAELEALQARSVESEQLYREKAAVLHQRDEAIKTLQNRRELKQQRIDSLAESIDAARRDVAAQREKIAQLSAERVHQETGLAETRAEMDSAQAAYRTSANAQLEAEETLQKSREAYQGFIQGNRDNVEENRHLREAMQKVEIGRENLAARRDRAETTLERLTTERRQRQETLDEAETALENARGDHDMYQQELTHLEARLETLRARQEELRETLSQDQGRLEKLRSRRDFLENLIRNYEGFSQSVQYVMSRKGEFNGVVDTLANLVDCEPEFRPALESYLSEVSNYLVVEDVGNARSILKNLRSENKGRLTVVPLPLLADNHLPAPGDLPAANGAIRPMGEVVTYPADYERLFGLLFRTVYIVPDLDTAIEIRRSHPHLTFVTPEGEILEHRGHLTGGTPGQRTGLIGRKEQLESVSAELATLTATVDQRRTELEQVQQEMGEREGKRREFAELLQGAARERTELEKRVDNTAFAAQRLDDTIEEMQRELAELDEQRAELDAEGERLLPELEAMEARLAAIRAEEEELLGRQQAAETALREVTRETQERQIAYLNLTSRAKESEQRLEFLTRSIADAERFITEREGIIADSEGQIAALRDEIAAIADELESGYKTRDAAETEKEESERRVHELRAQIQSVEVELKKKQRLLNQARERLQALELRIRELEVKLSGVREQIAESHSPTALDTPPESLDANRSVADVQNEIHDVRDKLEKLGEVNPLAIKEHEKEKERLDFLNTQRDDLLSAKEQLLETIGKLNTTARKQFMETFVQIQANFQRVFREFFEGGEAELKLVESRDPLEANIDIEVNHKGKKLNTLSLLSAGEKTLTAISLLFAIYLVKPSPFCILDEVDAPLDDVNIGRLTQALGLFSRDTQFILVTHNKKTMQATNQIYGITMEEKGVSKVVSVRFD